MEEVPSSYREYSVRCKTCNAQVACFAGEYEQWLSTGLTFEETLNQMGITNYCCRIAFMNPTVVMFNMENRLLIEGVISVDAAESRDVVAGNTSTGVYKSVFKTCAPGKQAGTPFLPPVPGATVQPGESVFARALPSTSSTVPTVLKPLNIAPLLAIGEPSVFEEGIPLTLVAGVQEMKIEEKQFQTPTTTGMSVINSSNHPNASVYVGNGKQIAVLTGRTYLAR